MRVKKAEKYQTRNGIPVTILTTRRRDQVDHKNVVALLHRSNYPRDDIMTYYANGRHSKTEETVDDLVQIVPFMDFDLNDPVIVWNEGDTARACGHFAGVDKETGKPMTWKNGGTQWTTKLTDAWDNCIKASVKI